MCYSRQVRLDKALRACRVRYARKSSFVFVRSSCLWFPPQSAVKKSRSAKARAGRQVGRSLSRNCTPIADRERRTAGRKVAEGSPTSRLLHLSSAKSTEQSENVYENKGRGQEVERSSAVSGVDPPLTRLATLATVPPGKRAGHEVWSGRGSRSRTSSAYPCQRYAERLARPGSGQRSGRSLFH